MTKRTGIGLFLCLASAWPLLAAGPAFDTTGNGLLSGSYYFRHVIYVISDTADVNGITGDIPESVAIFGHITFNGNGTYSIADGKVSDSYLNYENNGVLYQAALSCYDAWLEGGSLCTTGGTTVNGTYSISASGFGFIENPVTGDDIFGLVSANGVFVGSSTENSGGFNDLFIAALVPSPQPTSSFFQGSYSAVGFFPGGSPLDSRDESFQLSPNGAGSLGTVTVSGSQGNDVALSQTANGVTYTFSGGTAVLNFPANSSAAFFPGGAANPEYLYFSPDGNFFFGGSPSFGYDMIVGVRNPSGSQALSGLFYEAGLYQDDSQLGSAATADFDSYYGSLNATTAGDPASGGSGILVHQRDDSFFGGVFGYTFLDSFPQDPNVFEQLTYTTGAGGGVRIGQGVWPSIGIDVSLLAPTFSGPSVYLNPQAIVNAANFAPFTAGVSNGEFISLGGTNLAPGVMSAPANIFPLPTTLNGVQVLVNGEPAPLNYVSPTAIVAIVPFGNTFDLANFQVNNNGNLSNSVTELVTSTTPGIFTGDFGLGNAYVADATGGYIVTPTAPAQPGDIIEVFVGGMGTVYPVVPDGSAGPSGPLSNTTNTITADINGTAATVQFAGLAPTLAGLYQLNILIPSTVEPLNCAGMGQCYYLDIGGPDSYNAEALIPIGSGLNGLARQPAARAARRSVRRVAVPRSGTCFPAVKTQCKAQ